MTARVDRDPERIPGAPPGYRPITAGLGSCNRCGAAININDPIATAKHAEFHQGLRIMWATAHSSSPSTLEPEASPTEADRSRAEGANSRSGDGGTPPPSVATAPPGVAAGVPRPQPPGGSNRPTSGSAKGTRPDTPVRGRRAKPEELPGAAAGRGEPPRWGQ